MSINAYAHTQYIVIITQLYKVFNSFNRNFQKLCRLISGRKVLGQIHFGFRADVAYDHARKIEHSFDDALYVVQGYGVDFVHAFFGVEKRPRTHCVTSVKAHKRGRRLLPENEGRLKLRFALRKFGFGYALRFKLVDFPSDRADRLIQIVGVRSDIDGIAPLLGVRRRITIDRISKPQFSLTSWKVCRSLCRRKRC